MNRMKSFARPGSSVVNEVEETEESIGLPEFNRDNSAKQRPGGRWV